MDIEKLIERLRHNNIENNCHDCALGYYAFDAATALSMLQAENEKLRAELEQVKRERDAAIKTIFQWTGCPECKWWDSADEWCEKHDRSADCCGECCSPEWRGPHKED